MINGFISSIFGFFNGRPRKHPTSRNTTFPPESILPLAVGDEEIAPTCHESPPESDATCASIDLDAQANAIAGTILPRIVKAVAQQGSEIAMSMTKALADLSPAIEANLAVHGNKIGEHVLRRLDKQCRLFQALIERSVTPMGGRIVESMRDEISSHGTALRKEVTETCSAAAQRAAMKPVVDQLIALFDRINEEREFLGSTYRKDLDLVHHLASRQHHERCDGAVRSFALEVQIILRSIGVEPIDAGAGLFDAQLQRVVGVEPSPRADLDGHIARIVRAGWVWNGTLLRPESVVVFKKGN